MTSIKFKRRLLPNLLLFLLTVVVGTLNCEAKDLIVEVQLEACAFNPSRGE